MTVITNTEDIKRLNLVVNKRKPIELEALQKIKKAMAGVDEALEYHDAVNSDEKVIDACKDNAMAGITIAIEDLSATLKSEGF
ncbi:MAG: hypothetical protein WC998_02140 [Candidatus Paceibacterota bacterium]